MRSGFNSSVSLCRVIGMLMIVFCHIGTAVGSAAIGQLFQSGVHLFLFISGFLYSNKKIDDARKWMYGRILRVSVPCYIWVLLMCLAGLLMQQAVPLAMLVLSVLNLQGIHFLLTFLPSPSIISGASHLWFITAMMLCYVLTIFVKKWELIGEKKSVGGKILALTMVVTCLLGLLGIRFDYLWIYFAGYVAGKDAKGIDLKKYLMLTVAMAVAVVGRLLMKRYCDVQGDINAYLYVVIPVAYMAMALWIFYTVDLVNKRFDLMEKMKRTFAGPLIDWLDGISFYVYITHYAFTDAPFSVMGVTGSLAVNLLALLALTLVTSIVLKVITGWILKHLPKG